MKILLLDDHPLVRAALESVIQTMGREITVVAAATAAEARTALAESGPIDLALLDLQLPDASGFSLMAEWRRSHPDMPVVIISGSEHPADVVRALEEGALGFIPKRTANEVLLHALRMVMSGGIYVPPMALGMRPSSNDRSAWAGPAEAHEPGGVGLLGTALRTGQTDNAARRTAGRSRAGFGPQGELRLTPRQSEVLELLLQGQPNKLIARQLNLSVETVKDHVASLLRLLGVSSRTQAVLAVSQLMGGQASETPASPWAPTGPFAALHAATAGRVPV